MNRKLTYLLIVWCLMGCGKLFHKDGLRIESLDSFHDIHFHNSFEVLLVQDTSFLVTLEGDKDILKKVEITLENGVLNFRNNYKGKWLKPKNNKVKLNIHFDSLKTIYAHETCMIESYNGIKAKELGFIVEGKLNEANLQLDCDVFYYWNGKPCGGKITLSGKTNQLKLWNSALMQIDATQISPKLVWIENYAKADCHVRTSGTLKYGLFGQGNIYVHGNPSRFENEGETGSGKLIFTE